MMFVFLALVGVIGFLQTMRRENNPPPQTDQCPGPDRFLRPQATASSSGRRPMPAARLPEEPLVHTKARREALLFPRTRRIASATIARTAPKPSATALSVFSKNQTGSYMAGIGPITGRST